MSESIIQQKSFLFAVEAVKLYKFLKSEKHEPVLSKQLLRSATSIAANTREAVNAESKLDFIHKLSIAQKECDETRFWLELLKDTDYISAETFKNYHSSATELLKILRSIILTTKHNIQSKNANS